MATLLLPLPTPAGDGEQRWRELKGLILNSLSSPHSRRAYDAALEEFVAWVTADARELRFDRVAVLAYRADLLKRGLSPASVNLRLSAVRRLATEAAETGLISPAVAVGVLRVPGLRRRGKRLGKWLTLDEATKFLAGVDQSCTKGKRDAALLAMLIGTGLRRDEIVQLNFSQVTLLSDRWVISDLVGKGGRVRTVAVPDWVRAQLDTWLETAQITNGPFFRRVLKNGLVSEQGITGQCVFKLVRHYAVRSGMSLTPHDLRRTYARLAHDGKARLEQIQYSLGHSSVATTEIYLGVHQDLRSAPCDYFRIGDLGHEVFPKA